MVGIGHDANAYVTKRTDLKSEKKKKKKKQLCFDPVLVLSQSKGTSRQRSGKGAIRKRFPLQKPRWEKTKLTIRYLYHETAAIFPIGGHSVTLT